MVTRLDGCTSSKLGSNNTIGCMKTLARNARSELVEDVYLV